MIDDELRLPSSAREARRWVRSLNAGIRRNSDEPSHLLALRWANLGAAQVHLGRLAQSKASFASAARSFGTALELLPRRGNRDKWVEIQEAVATANFLVAMAAKERDDKSERLSTAAQALTAAIAATQRHADLEAWRRRHRQLGEVLLLLHAEDDEPSGLQQTILVLRQALATPVGVEKPLERAELLGNLAKAEAYKAELVGDHPALASAADLAREAVKVLRRLGEPGALAALKSDLTDILVAQGRRTQDDGCLREAVLSLRAAIRTDPSQSQQALGDRLRLLGVLLYERGELKSNERLLQASAAAFRRAISTYRPGGDRDAKLMSELNLGVVLQRIGEIAARPELMDEALTINATVAAKASKRGNIALWAKAQLAYALALMTIAEQRRDSALFRQAIAVLERGQAVTDSNRDPEEWSTFEHNRALILSRLGQMSNEPAAMREAVSALEAALDTPIDGPDRAETLNQLALCRRNLGDMMQDRDLLELATEDFGRQLDLLEQHELPEGIPRVYCNRGTTFSTLGEIFGETHYLERAIKDYRFALDEYTRRRASFDCAMVQLNLGGALMGLGEMLRSDGHLEQALIHLDASLEVYRPDRSPQDYGKAMNIKGRTLLSLAIGRRDPKLRAAALKALVAALHVFDAGDDEAQAQDTAVYVIHALIEAGKFREAEALLRKTIARSEAAIHSSKRSADSHDLALDQVAGLHALLSFCLLRRPKPAVTAALRAAEEGQARLLRKSLGELDPNASKEQQDSQQAASGSLAMSSAGAVVVPVLTRFGSFAFVITEKRGIELLQGEFAQFTLGKVQKRARTWLATYEATVASSMFQRSSAPEELYGQWNSTITDTVHWLWDAFFETVDRHLREAVQYPAGAPVVLIPASPMNIFPLHAARGASGESSFGERWTVSVGPSMHVMMACEQRSRERRTRPVELLVVMGASNLIHAGLEVDFIKRRYSRLLKTGLKEGSSRLATVRRALTSASHLHVSTHGRHNTSAPRRSTLDLADVAVTGLELAGGQPNQLRLVYLSACETAVAGTRRLEQEFLGLTSAFLQAGAPCVVASLWPVFDDAAYLLARRFYELFLSEAGEELCPPASAMREAQGWLRNLTRTEAADLLTHAKAASKGNRRNATAAATVSASDDSALDRPFAALHEWAGFIVTGA